MGISCCGSDVCSYDLFATLAEFGLSRGRYDARIDDGLTLDGAIIVNSVKCLPPQNKPIPSEIANCRPFFERQLAALPNVRVIIALGRIAHDEIGRASCREGVGQYV